MRTRFKKSETSTNIVSFNKNESSSGEKGVLGKNNSGRSTCLKTKLVKRSWKDRKTEQLDFY